MFKVFFYKLSLNTENSEPLHEKRGLYFLALFGPCY